MDLFASAGVDTVYNPLPQLDDWVDYFSQEELYSMSSYMTLINDRRGLGDVIYPEQDEILKAFETSHPDRTKVIIIGQDPYHNGNANGYAFACKKKMSPSLSNIIKGLKNDIGDNVLANQSLNAWIDQGVLLLNTVLTVEKGKPASHSSVGWTPILKNVIERLSDRQDRLIFMLWGRQSQAFLTRIDHSKHVALTAEHPAAASYKGGTWHTNNFSTANKYLEKFNLTPIQW